MDSIKNGRWILIHGDLAKDDKVVYECSECGARTEWKKGMKGIYPGSSCHSCFANMTNGRTACLD